MKLNLNPIVDTRHSAVGLILTEGNVNPNVDTRHSAGLILTVGGLRIWNQCSIAERSYTWAFTVITFGHTGNKLRH